MRSRLFWRRSAAAAGTYASAALGFGATVVALHVFSTETFGRYALVLAATAFAQSLLDLTVEEALVKFGFRYTTREDWGRLRRLFESAVAFKLAGGALATVLLLAIAPFADTLLHQEGLTTPILIGAFIPLAQCTENVGLAGRGAPRHPLFRRPVDGCDGGHLVDRAALTARARPRVDHDPGCVLPRCDVAAAGVRGRVGAGAAHPAHGADARLGEGDARRGLHRHPPVHVGHGRPRRRDPAAAARLHA